MAKKKSVKEVTEDVMSKEELKKVKKAKQVERRARMKEMIESLPFNQVPTGRLINVISEGGNHVKQYAVPIKVSKTDQHMLITSVVLDASEKIISVSTSYIPENLRVKVTDGSGKLLPRKIKDKKGKSVEDDDTEED